ncbi:hypothetical protein OCU04_007249 [Sclerotinia nivalis]|uniref:Uncharacterized protein n=1 Tax=Sclerotinia nivalis TaxID=352851 RepID=A0A9X0ALF8_9HELO|nr:hypothetical protein OCU04_007249 [Sclerotinia nivalis]
MIYIQGIIIPALESIVYRIYLLRYGPTLGSRCTLHNCSTLGALAQTCKVFSDVFIPIFYSRRIVYVDKRWQSKLPVVNNHSILSNTLIHTKDLEFHLIEDSMIGDDMTNYEEFDEFAAKVLNRTPNLRSFRIQTICDCSVKSHMHVSTCK